METAISIIIFLIVAAAIYLWMRKRAERKRRERKIELPPTTPAPPGGHPDWNKVWCNAIAAGMPPTSTGLLDAIRRVTGNPNWMPPECD